MKQYKQIGQIGEGTFGRVFKAQTPQGKLLAIKKIKFDEQGDEGGMPSTALREISVLRRLSDEPYVVKLLDIENEVKDKKLALIFEYYDCDLRRYIRDTKEDLDQKTIKRIMKQLLMGVHSMHAKKIMHRDLKPHNILLDCDKNVKIADFGLARYVTSLQKPLTREVETLWYRAPELMLGKKKYGFAVDVWAIGCIFAELFLKRPLFYGGSHEVQQIFKVFEIMGTPTKEYWPEVEILQNFSPKFPKWKPQSLESIIPKMPPSALSLLDQMLQTNPAHRICTRDALDHQYLSDIEA